MPRCVKYILFKRYQFLGVTLCSSAWKYAVAWNMNEPTNETDSKCNILHFKKYKCIFAGVCDAIAIVYSNIFQLLYEINPMPTILSFEYLKLPLINSSRTIIAYRKTKDQMCIGNSNTHTHNIINVHTHHRAIRRKRIESSHLYATHMWFSPPFPPLNILVVNT